MERTSKDNVSTDRSETSMKGDKERVQERRYAVTYIYRNMRSCLIDHFPMFSEFGRKAHVRRGIEEESRSKSRVVKDDLMSSMHENRKERGVEDIRISNRICRISPSLDARTSPPAPHRYALSSWRLRAVYNRWYVAKKGEAGDVYDVGYE